MYPMRDGRSVHENQEQPARTLNYIGSRANAILEWLRMPGDVVFIVGGTLPLLYLTCLGVPRPRTSSTTEGPKDVLFTDIATPVSRVRWKDGIRWLN